MEPHRESLWNIEYTWIFYTLAALTVLILLYAIYRHYRRWKVGQPANRGNQLGRRLLDFLNIAIIDGLVHRKFFGADHKDWRFREFYPGLIHFFIFSGFFMLFLATALEFINHYIVPLLYPAGLDKSWRILLGSVVVVLNLAIYGWVLRRRKAAKYPRRDGDSGCRTG